MYIEELMDFDIKLFMNENYDIYSHVKNNRYEKLDEHISLCKKYFKNILTKKSLEETLVKIENIFLSDYSNNVKKLYRQMIVSIITMHDLGKLNIVFQKIKMNNDLKISNVSNRIDSSHSMYSSLIYMEYYLGKILKIAKDECLSKENRSLLLAFLMLNSFIISRHHAGFSNLSEYVEKLLDLCIGDKLIDYMEVIKETYKKRFDINKQKINGVINGYNKFLLGLKDLEDSNRKAVYLYVYERLMLSLLLAVDYYSTSEFMNEVEVKDLGNISNIDEFYNVLKDGDIYKSIREYEKDRYLKEYDFKKVTDINVLRNELFLDAEEILLKNLDKNIFYLEAPTGSGKSNVANNLAYKLIEKDPRKNKLFYVYPFNTLVEQNLENLNKVYEFQPAILDKITVINSLFPIKVLKEYESEEECFADYEKALLNRQFLNYPMILTTHVSFFRYLFGCIKEDIFPVHQLANSVVILDEIQSYKNKIWREIIEFLHGYADILNIKIIIMSATLPDLDTLLLSEGNSVKLIQDVEKYFTSSVFKNRVKIDYTLLDTKINFEILTEKIIENNGKKILIEFINKSSAYSFYDFITSKEYSERINLNIRLLTGDDNSIERNKILNEIKNAQNIILIATQVIEAGVDIDMDIGFKNISILDSEEQFLGRINRSFLKEDCTVYFFDLDPVSSVYKNDIRAHSDLLLHTHKVREILKNKSFKYYYIKVLEKLMDITCRYNNLNIKSFFEDDVAFSNLIDIESRMKLIDDDCNDISVFINRKINKDGVEILGNTIWEEYKLLLKNNDLDYSEKVIKLSRIKSYMNYFVYRIRTKNNFNYDDRIGDILYIENGEEYFLNGKLNKTKFEENNLIFL